MKAAAGALGTGLLALVLPLAGCGDDRPAPGPEPTGVSIAPSSAAPSTQPPSTQAPSTQAPSSAGTSRPPVKPTSGPSTAQSEQVTTLLAAVAVAEAAVPDSSAVEVSKDDDDGQLTWEVTVRAGENGRELRISGTDGSVLSNTADQLDQSQLGAEPSVTVRDAVEIAEKRVAGGVATSAELSRENGQRVWDVSVDAGGGEEWELWIDASSGKVLRRERD